MLSIFFVYLWLKDITIFSTVLGLPSEIVFTPFVRGLPKIDCSFVRGGAHDDYRHIWITSHENVT